LCALTEAKRFAAFEDRLAEINKLNAENPTATFGVNQFADLTAAEFHARYLNLDVEQLALAQKRMPAYQPRSNVAPRALPTSYTSPYITPVKNQGQCGSCWAFATAAVVEAAIKKQTSATVDVAEQQLVSCSKSGSYGCSGGNYDSALAYVKANGMMLEANYPYTATDSTCAYNAAQATQKIANVYNVPMSSADQAVYDYGAVAFALDANTLQSYTGGIILNTAACNKGVNHAVTLYGWGVSGTTNYYLVKNSWATSWGESGNFRIARGACLMNTWSGAGASSTAGPCTPSKTCGTRVCGSIDNGCGSMISCGTCASGKVCTASGACTATGGVEDWTQVYPAGGSDFTVTKSGSTLTASLKASTATTKKRLSWTTSSQFIQAAWTSFTAQVTASTTGVFGLGMRLG
jgi:hypothetical protein